MRDEVFQIIREFDEGERKPKYSHGPYVNWYENADTEKEILVFDDWESVRDLENALYEICKDEKEFLESLRTEYNSENEYNVSALEYMCEGDENWTFSDEGFDCSECGKWHFYDNRGYTSYANYFVGDGYILCEDCTKEDSEPYFDSLINNPTKANTLFDDQELKDLGWQRVNEETFDNGWYEWNKQSDPKKILESALEEDPNGEYIFSIHKTGNPWETEFDLWRREHE